MIMNRRGLLIILSSPSGAGKSTLAKRLTQWDPSLSFSVSATTREKRTGEVDGRDYYFKSIHEFSSMITAGEMLEHAQVFGNLYGSPVKQIETSLKTGSDILFDIDWQGAQQINNSQLKDQVLSIFILPPSITELRRRLEMRGLDSACTINKRMAKSLNEINQWESYDFVLVNQDVEHTMERLKTIITSERMRQRHQSLLMKHVCRLQDEFGEML